MDTIPSKVFEIPLGIHVLKIKSDRPGLFPCVLGAGIPSFFSRLCVLPRTKQRYKPQGVLESGSRQWLLASVRDECASIDGIRTTRGN